MSIEPLPTTDAPLASVTALVEQARAYVEAAKAPSTCRSYRANWQDFTAWCEQQAVASLPTTLKTVALYVTALADRCKVATIQRRLVALSQAHQAAHLDTPTASIVVREVMKGVRRRLGLDQTRKNPKPYFMFRPAWR